MGGESELDPQGRGRVAAGDEVAHDPHHGIGQSISEGPFGFSSSGRPSWTL
jgi:hypothetical protein